jgi:hypothetical protein
MTDTLGSSRDVTLGLGRPPWPGSPISSRWRATYSIPGLDTRLEGGLILRHAERRLVLLDHEGIAVDVRQADPANSIEAGTIVKFPFYRGGWGNLGFTNCSFSCGPIACETAQGVGPRALFPLDHVSARADSRPDQAGVDRDSVNLPLMAATYAALTCLDQSSGGADSARVIPPQPHSITQISRFQHIWDRGRAAGAPRVVFVDREIRPSILRPAQPSSWRGTVTGDSRSFAAVARSAPMSNFGRGGRGGP